MAVTVYNRLNKICAAIALSLFCGLPCRTLYAQVRLASFSVSDPISLSFGLRRPIPLNYLGYNIDVGGYQVNWHGSSFIDRIDGLAPGTLRFPGGSLSNFYRWKTGYVTARAPENFKWIKNRAPLTLDDLHIATHASKAVPIFVLNMLTSTLGSQVAMLKRAAKIGLPVDYIELGNEFYFSNPRDLTMFPTPQRYGEIASVWASALHTEFPTAKVAAVGAYAPWPLWVGRRRGHWNHNVLQTLNGIDAITLHYYVNVRRILSRSRDQITSKTIPLILSSPFDNLPALKKVISEIPANLPIWITEFNVVDATWRQHKRSSFGRLPGTWAQGLVVGTMIFEFLNIPQIQRLDFHSLDDSRVFGAIYTGGSSAPYPTPTRFAYSASGQVLKLFGTALKGAFSYETVHFSDAPMIRGVKGTYPALLGGLFSKSDSVCLLIENLSSTTVSVDPTSVVTGSYRIDKMWAKPSSRILNQNSLKAIEVSGRGQLRLPPYSVTLIE